MWFFFKKNNYFKNNILINKLLSAQVVKKAISTLLVIQILYNPLISRTCYNLHKPSEKSLSIDFCCYVLAVLDDYFRPDQFR